MLYVFKFLNSLPSLTKGAWKYPVVQMAASMVITGYTPTVDFYSSLESMLLIPIYIQEVPKNFIHKIVFSKVLNIKLVIQIIIGALS